ncbi:MAG: GDP-mannose 4,6-dehydratase [Kiritimatiellae bacterium]|nr:GDP-mannose 4,6-dehydratase [Kiritimatiellia bacterium]
MQILLTGGAGFLGSHLADRLVGRGDAVLVLDNLNSYYDPAVKRANMAGLADAPGFTFVEGDILHDNILGDIFAARKFDVVVHLAARAGVRASVENPGLYEEVNCRGTLNLLNLAVRRKVARFVFASSSSVYGNSAAVPFRETEHVNRPISPYAATKAAGELLCYTTHHLYGLSVNVLRFFTAYGPRQRPDMAIHKFTRLIDRGESIPFYGDGSSERDYTYCGDIIDGVVAAIDRDLGFEILNLGESRTTKLSALVAIIEKNLGKKAVLEKLPLQPGDVQRTCADISKARRLLGYNPGTTVEEGIARFVEWYRATAKR